MWRPMFMIVAACLACGARPGLAGEPPFGIETRASNTTLLIDSVPPTSPEAMQLVRMFPRLAFDGPVFLTQAPGDPTRLFVLERRGRILVFPKIADPAPEDVAVFLDLTAVTATAWEEGLLGLAFDPDYMTNGTFYVFYSWNGTAPATSRISRFVNPVPGGLPSETPAEEVILAVAMQTERHHGGTLEFGPDGMLYLSFGDGHDDAGTCCGQAQDTRTLQGSILRIDVRSSPDPGLNYAIPADNPFVAGGPAGLDTRKEIWAYGIRNSYRAAIDPVTGVYYAADVGDEAYEEVNVILPGRNYGWPYAEGLNCRNDGGCGGLGLTWPVAVYGRDQGFAVIGGGVYLGADVPSLYGMFLYADYVTRRVWGMRHDPVSGTTTTTLLIAQATNVTLLGGSGRDLSGEVYWLDFVEGSASGGVYVVRPVVPSPPVALPTRLSAMPALLAAGSGADQTGEGILPYHPAAELWSDGARKERFLALPGLATVGFTTSGGWDFPDGSVLIKNFSLPQDFRDPSGTARRIETRLLVRDGTQWHGFSYEWNEEETDAVLLPPGAKRRPFSLVDREGVAFDYEWHYPSRAECFSCHTPAANVVLGLQTAQMNSSFLYPASGVVDNQLRTLEHLGLFGGPLPAPPSELAAATPPFDPAAGSLRERAKAYLNANCAMCHRPGGPIPLPFEFRWETPLRDMGIYDVAPLLGNLGIDDARLLAPRDADRSIIPARMSHPDTYRMPPLGTSRIDDDGVALLREWISRELLFEASGIVVE